MTFTNLKAWVFLTFLFSVQGLKADNTAVMTQAILQGAIMVEEYPQPTQFHSDKIQPGNAVSVSILVENKGEVPSPRGDIYVRFGLAKPLDKEVGSVLFETEKLELPSIEPGSKVELKFEKKHQLPSVPDFIRNDWAMREYQAIVNVGGEQKMIGTLAITFSAYYYPGIRKELPNAI